jgi:hypothetical protein
MNSLNNPNYSGPGIWWSIHTIASEAKNTESKNSFLAYVKIIEEKFPCKECRNHFKEYVDKNNPNSKKYLDVDKGLFLWSWECHNNANLITGKKIFPYTEAEKMYYSPEVCTLACGSGIQPPPTKNNKPSFKGVRVNISPN